LDKEPVGEADTVRVLVEDDSDSGYPSSMMSMLDEIDLVGACRRGLSEETAAQLARMGG
jgi:hypothetical protein